MERTKLYFTVFGAINLKIQILQDLKHFWKIIFWICFQIHPGTQLGAPGAVHPRSLTSGTCLPAGPAGQSAERGKIPVDGLPPVRPPGRNQGYQLARLPFATRSHPAMRPKTKHSELATGNCGPAALSRQCQPPHAGRAHQSDPSQLMESRRPRCAR